MKRVEVPLYQELNVDGVMEAYGEDELFRKFLPEITAKGKKQHREYLFNVLNTLYPL